MSALFDIERGPDGWPKFGPVGPPEPTPKQAHRFRCYVNGVFDPADIAALWREEQAKRTAARKAEQKGRK